MIKGTFVAAAASLAMLTASSADAGLIISEVVDGTLSGGNPKFVEITNTGVADFTFTGGGIINQSNAATDLDIDVDLTGVTILAGQSYVIQSTSNGGQAIFESTYGFAADLYTTAYFSNGDDRYILADADDGLGAATNLVDIHGDINTDGTGLPWEYLDGYAYRLPTAITGNGGVFAIGEWFHSGVNGLEDPGYDDVVEAALIVAQTTPGTHNYVPEPASLALISLGGLAMLRRR
jgi:lamin tail-like protein/PEP-CTERM motif-containing protein